MADKRDVNWRELLLQEGEESSSTLQELAGRLKIEEAGDAGKLVVELRLLTFIYGLEADMESLEKIASTALKLACELQELAKKNGGTSPEKKRSASMAQEWVQGFEHFLLLSGVRENTREIYVRAVKRVMKQKEISDIEEIRREIEAIVTEYREKTRATDKVNYAALRQFQYFCEDECGFVITIVHNGVDDATQRLYVRRELAESVFEETMEDYKESVEAVRMYDKFGKLLLERICN